MYPFTLSGIKAGITRLRYKGGANPDSLYDAVNCYINAARDLVPRPGSQIAHTLPAGTIGLTVFSGKRHVYADHYVAMTDPGYILHVIQAPGDTPPTLVEIHFAEPLMGFLFVVAEFSDGKVYSYWLTEGVGDSTGTWTANTIYQLNGVVRPVTPNGFTYSATRLNPPEQAWKASVERQVGDKVEPTVYNGFYYQVVEVDGTRPRSGLVEPTWSTVEDGLTVEDADNIDPTPAPTDPSLPPDVPGRYGGGGNGGGGNTGVPRQQV